MRATGLKVRAAGRSFKPARRASALSTARQIWLQRCLGLPTPGYRHLPLVLDAHGHKLSKSEQAFPVDPGDPVPALCRALAFLRLPTPAGVAGVNGVLAHALAHFEPDVLPHCSGHSAA